MFGFFRSVFGFPRGPEGAQHVAREHSCLGAKYRRKRPNGGPMDGHFSCQVPNAEDRNNYSNTLRPLSAGKRALASARVSGVAKLGVNKWGAIDFKCFGILVGCWAPPGPGLCQTVAQKTSFRTPKYRPNQATGGPMGGKNAF